MGRRYVENPPGSRFYYDTVDDPTVDDDFKEFRIARINRGWVPENPTDEELSLIYKVAKKMKKIEDGWVPENPTDEELSLMYKVAKKMKLASQLQA